MKKTIKIILFLVNLLFLLLSASCASNTNISGQPEKVTHSNFVTKSHHHPNPYQKISPMINVEEKPLPIQDSNLSKNLKRILNTKTNKTINLSGDIYLNDGNLNETPILKKLDGGYIDVEVKFKE